MICLGVACSSKSTGGGGGSILGGGSGGTSSTAGTSASDAGTTSNNTGGSTSNNNTGGRASSSGGTGGGADDCANAPIVCVDAMTASTCNPDTGKDMTINCVTDLKALGIVSAGCKMDAVNGDGCTIDDLTDKGCADGTAPWGVCHNLTSDQALDIYVGCYKNTNGLHDEIACYAKYYDETANTLDCTGASTECDPLTMP
jgi:hypothetical protein